MILVEEKDGKLILSQKRFLSSGEAPIGDIYYPVCLHIRYSGGKYDNSFLMQESIVLDAPDDDFFKFVS